MTFPVFVVSDVHLGCVYSRIKTFQIFMDNLPGNAPLVLNGDTVHHPDARRLPPHHSLVLDALRRESRRREIIWLRGNHDERFEMQSPADIRFAPSHAIGRRLFLAHGYDFDNVMPHNRLFIILFRALHAIRIRLGAEAVHVAHYAKRFPLLYRVLLNHVTSNAVEYAVENNFEAVACGHTHFPEDRSVRGVRYLNTGSWTEDEVCYLRIDERSMRLCRRPEDDFTRNPVLE